MDIDGSGIIDPEEFCEYFMQALPSDKDTFDTTVKQFLDCARECHVKKQIARDQAQKSPKTPPEVPLPAEEAKQEATEEPDFLTLYPNSKPARVKKLTAVHYLLDVDKIGAALKEHVAEMDTYDAEKNEAAMQWLEELETDVSEEDFGEYFHRALPVNQLAFDGIIKNFTAIAKQLGEKKTKPKVPPVPKSFQSEVASDPLVAELMGEWTDEPTAAPTEDESSVEKQEVAIAPLLHLSIFLEATPCWLAQCGSAFVCLVA